MPRDIVERLRDRAYSGLPDPLLAEAADEIVRLRNGALSGCESVQPATNLDAAPAAKANAESVAPQPTAGDRSGNPTSHSGTGRQPAPPSVETDGFSSGSSSELINRKAERQSPDRECGESSLRDVPQLDNSRAAGGPEHHISEAQIDALRRVVENGRFIDMSDYGHLRSLLVRLRPEWESDRPQPVKDDVFDRSKPINADRLSALDELSALDQELELKHGIKGNPMIKARQRTPPPQTTPTQGSVQGEGSFRDSRNANEPVAWAVMYPNGEFGILAFYRREAEDRATASDRVVPLYRSPTLTDAEREAVEFFAELPWAKESGNAAEAATLRGLLERLE